MTERDRGARWAWLPIAALIAVGLLAWTLRPDDPRPDAAPLPPAVAAAHAGAPLVPTLIAAAHGTDARTRPRPAARSTPRTSTQSPSFSAGGTAGMVVAIDPETGALGPPSPEQLQELARAGNAAASKNSDGLEEIHLPDGTVIMTLDHRFEEFAVARIGPNGKPVLGCAPGHAHLERAGAAAPVPVRVLEEE